MKKILFLLLIMSVKGYASEINIRQANYNQSALDILNKVIDELGGLKKMDTINYIKKHYNAHKYWVEQSEFHNGPFITSYENVTEINALKKERLYQEVSVKQFQFENSITSKVIINDDKADMVYGEKNYPMPQSYKDEIFTIANYDPIKLTLLALNTSTSNLEKETVNIDDIDCYVIRFTKNQLAYSLYINKNSYLPHQVVIETCLPHENFFSPFGNFNTTIKYSLYHYLKKGMRYPFQWDIYRLGHKWKSVTCDKVEFLNSVESQLFSAKNSSPKIPRIIDQIGNFDYVKEIDTNVNLLLGQWFVHWIIQDDGILILEAPISSSYSKSIIEHLKKKHPSLPIKGIVVASDAYPHIAGIREYVAQKIPIYTHRNNEKLLNKVIKSHHRTNPDALELNKMKPIYRFIDDKLDIKNISLYPINGNAGSKMLMVYKHDAKWLYAADLIQKLPDNSFFMPQYLTEVENAVKSNKLEVQKVSAMHLRITKWIDIKKYLNSI